MASADILCKLQHDKHFDSNGCHNQGSLSTSLDKRNILIFLLGPHCQVLLFHKEPPDVVFHNNRLNYLLCCTTILQSSQGPWWQILVHLWVRQFRILLQTWSHNMTVAWPHLMWFFVFPQEQAFVIITGQEGQGPGWQSWLQRCWQSESLCFPHISPQPEKQRRTPTIKG